MTSLEKSIAVKKLIMTTCGYTGCVDCQFFNPEDATDGEYFCHLRDIDNKIPYHHDWHMESAMLNSRKSEVSGNEYDGIYNKSHD